MLYFAVEPDPFPMSAVDALKKEVQNLMAEGEIKAGLEAVRTALQEESRHFNTILLLLGQYHQTKRQEDAFVLQPGQANSTYARIRNAVLDLVKDFKEKDLKPGTTPSPAADTPAPPPDRSGPLRLFISYAHEDEAYKDRLIEEIMVLQRIGAVHIWNDRDMVVGMEWDREIKQQLATADIICLLVSKDFIASEYCWSEEMKAAIHRHEQGAAKIAPIVIRKVNHFNRLPFAKIVALPKDALPVESHEDLDAVWAYISDQIGKLVDSLQKT